MLNSTQTSRNLTIALLTFAVKNKLCVKTAANKNKFLVVVSFVTNLETGGELQGGPEV